MHFKKPGFLFFAVLLSLQTQAQQADALRPDFTAPHVPEGMKLAWSDEFNYTGPPDPQNWSFETGFVRNRELQWYKAENAACGNGVLLIEGRRETIPNPAYVQGSNDWKANRESASFSSASIRTRGLRQWLYGRFEIRARIDTSRGSWPAIWTLGVDGAWPSNGEIDIMEFYRVNNEPTILANIAWSSQQRSAVWDSEKIPLAKFLARDKDWVKKFHVWRMDWNPDGIKLYLDDELLNSASAAETRNGDGSNPFTKPQYLLLNLALGANGGDPSAARFPIRYEVDYVRVFQEK